MASVQRHPSDRRGLSLGLLTGLAKMAFWLVFALLFSIVVEWVGMLFWWPEQGVQHSQNMLAQELTYLNSDFRYSIVSSNPAAYSQSLMDGVYIVLFEWTHLIDVITWLSSAPAAGDSFWLAQVKIGYRSIAEFVLAAITITQVFAVRLAVLTLALPAFVLFNLVALVDGLVQRDLRRWGGGREHGWLYHHAKRLIFPALLLAWIIYLGLPFSAHPNFVILPFAVLSALALATTAATFKKYL